MAPLQRSACTRAPAASSPFVSTSSSPAAAKKPVVLTLAAPSRPIKKPACPVSSSRCVMGPTKPIKKPSHPASSSRPASSKKSARAPAGDEFMASRGAQTVHPARRLACRTAVYVRTTFVLANIKCRILLWLSARVVSASGASHHTVKYAANLNPMFAGKVVRLPVEHVREAPRRPTAATATRQ